MHKVSSAILLILCVAIPLSAQTIIETETSASDFQVRTGIQIEKTWKKTFQLSLEEEARFKSCVTEFDKLYSTLSFDYKPIKYFKTGIGYSFILINHDGKKSTDYQKYLDMRHRAFISIEGSYTVNDWKFSLRERPILTIRTDSVNPLEKAPYRWDLRSRIMAEYKWFGKPLKSYLAVEVSNTLNAPDLADGNYINKVRTTLGVKYKISAHHSFDFFYRFDANFNKDINIKKSGNVNVTNEQEFNHIIGVFYNFSL